MLWFKKVTLKSLEEKTGTSHPDVLDIIVQHLEHATVSLDMALREFRKAPFDKIMLRTLEMCLSIIAKSAIILRVKFIQEPWEIDWDKIDKQIKKIDNPKPENPPSKYFKVD